MSVEPTLLPPWKLELLERKRRQENTLHTSSGESTHDTTRTYSNSSKYESVDMPAWKRDIILRRQQQKSNASRHSNIEPSVSVSINEGIVRSASTSESVNADERLLPIKKNPILLHDLEQRQQTSYSASEITHGDSFRGDNSYGSVSPNASTDIRNSSVFSANQSPLEEINDASFTAEQDEGGLKYGKGFVNRLLKKFSGLTNTGDKLINSSVPSVKTSRRSRSPGERIQHDDGNHGTSDGRKTTTEVTRSYDDLLQDPSSPTSVLLNNGSNRYGSVPNGLGNLSLTAASSDDKSDASPSLNDPDSVELPNKEDEKPQANIVSNVRNMFEQFVSKPQVPPKRFAVQQSESAAQTRTIDTKLNKASGVASKPHTVIGNASFNTVHNQYSTSNNTANNMHSPSSIVKKDINENDSLVVLAPTNTKYSAAAARDESKVATNHEIPSKIFAESDLDNSSLVASSNKNESIYNHDLSATPSNQSKSDVLKEQSIEAAANYKAPLIPAVDSKSSGNSDTSKKSPPARPGKLLIRPASNLVAANTKTEYLELTKYNDVKTGEFAPPSDRPLPPAGNGYDDDDIDGGDDTLTGKSFEFIGGGVKLERSLLLKTKPYVKLSIQFDDNATSTYEYESEQSLMDSTPAEPGDCDYVATEGTSNNYSDHNDNISESDHFPSSSSLMTTPALGGSSGSLSSYKSRMQVSYQFGMNDSMNEQIAPTELVAQKTAEPIEPEPAASWSGTGTSDLLF